MIYEEMPSGAEALYVGDNDYDSYVIWSGVWQPSSDEAIFKELTISDEVSEAGDEETNSTSKVIERIVLHLRNLSSHIDWKIQYNGSDDYNIRWLEIAVPEEHVWEAEFIIEKIETNGSMLGFSCYEEFYPNLFDADKSQRREIRSFIDAVKALTEFIYNDYSDYWDSPNKQIFILTNILVNLYRSGCELNQIRIDIPYNYSTNYSAILSDYGNCQFALDMYNRFNNCKELLNESHDALKTDNDELLNLFETVEFIIGAIDYDFNEFNGFRAFDKSYVVGNWQVDFMGTGWGSAILEILPKLHELSFKLKYLR